MIDYVECKINSETMKLSVPLKKKLQTFDSLNIRKRTSKKQLGITAESDRIELSAVLVAIANPDGSLFQTNKAQTLKDAETEASASLHYDYFMKAVCGQNAQTDVFIDHMACVQKLSSRKEINTFGDLVDSLG